MAHVQQAHVAQGSVAIKVVEAENQGIMGVDSSDIKWHWGTLPKATKKALDFLSKRSFLSKNKWYLAGGTALALQAGHRQSVDLDFFTELPSFTSSSVLRHFRGKDWKSIFDEDKTIYGEFMGAKLSFIAYPFFIPKQKPLKYGFVRILDKADIAVMKIVAISQRGRKRDFFDLYWYANNVEPLDKVLRRLKAQYPSVAHDYHHILKSMVYFLDAEADPNPKIMFKANWRQVKAFFSNEIPKITSEVLKLY